MPEKPKRRTRARKPSKPLTSEAEIVEESKSPVEPISEPETPLETPFLDYDDVVRVMGEFKVDLQNMVGVYSYVDPKSPERVVLIAMTTEFPGGFALLLDRKGVSQLYAALAILEDNA